MECGRINPWFCGSSCSTIEFSHANSTALCLLVNTQRHICANRIHHSLGWCEACGNALPRTSVASCVSLCETTREDTKWVNSTPAKCNDNGYFCALANWNFAYFTLTSIVERIQKNVCQGRMVIPIGYLTSILISMSYSISQEICTRFCCVLLCCGYAIVHNKFTWSIYPYSSGLLCWHWGNR